MSRRVNLRIVDTTQVGVLISDDNKFSLFYVTTLVMIPSVFRVNLVKKT